MKTNEEKNQAFWYGVFAAQSILDGIIQPDMKKSNIGVFEDRMVFIDYADATKIHIPEELTAETLRRLSRSILPLFDSFPDFESKSYLRAGFTARGGILTDIIMHKCMDSGFFSLMFFKDAVKTDISEYNAYGEVSLPLTEQLINEWISFPTEKTVESYLNCARQYWISAERERISSFNRYFLDRFFYSCNYMEIPAGEFPALFANAGCSAFKHNRKYRAYGLLQKAIPLLNGGWKSLLKICKKNLNETIHMKNLNPEIKAFIDDHIDMDYFELTWILDDFDLMSS